MSEPFLSDINRALMNPHWRPDNRLSQSLLPTHLEPWLSHRGSLTAALKAIADGTFEVEVIRQTIQQPFWHEQKVNGGMSGYAAMVREVRLRIYREPVVYARSIIPLSLSGRGGGGLASLGKSPLGHLLFKSGQIHVASREFAQLLIANEAVYARRTPYDYLDQSILVSEVFLPRFLNYL